MEKTNLDSCQETVCKSLHDRIIQESNTQSYSWMIDLNNSKFKYDSEEAKFTFLQSGFDWETTTEGFNYWRNIKILIRDFL